MKTQTTHLSHRCREPILEEPVLQGRVSELQWGRWVSRTAQAAQLIVGVALAVTAVAIAARTQGLACTLATGPAGTSLYVFRHLEATARQMPARSSGG